MLYTTTMTRKYNLYTGHRSSETVALVLNELFVAFWNFRYQDRNFKAQTRNWQILSQKNHTHIFNLTLSPNTISKFLFFGYSSKYIQTYTIV